MPPGHVKPYVKRGKTDAANAGAICEAVTRPSMRFVPMKTEAQQAVLMMHRTRDFLVRQLTQGTNAIRAHLAGAGCLGVAQDRRELSGFARLRTENGTRPVRVRW
jgi:transposase